MKEHAEITVRDIANRTSSHMVIKDNGNGSTLWSGYQYNFRQDEECADEYEYYDATLHVGTVTQ